MSASVDKELEKLRSKFEKKMGDAWEKYDSSEWESDLEEYGEDYEKAYTYLFNSIETLIEMQTAALKQELKQSLEAEMPEKRDDWTVDETPFLNGFNAAVDSFQGAIDGVFGKEENE